MNEISCKLRNILRKGQMYIEKDREVPMNCIRKRHLVYE